MGFGMTSYDKTLLTLLSLGDGITDGVRINTSRVKKDVSPFRFVVNVLLDGVFQSVLFTDYVKVFLFGE